MKMHAIRFFFFLNRANTQQLVLVIVKQACKHPVRLFFFKFLFACSITTLAEQLSDEDEKILKLNLNFCLIHKTFFFVR